MVVYTLEQRYEKLLHYLENDGNVAICLRKLRTDFGRREAPFAPYVRYLVKKIKETGIFIDKPNREEPKTVHTAGNIVAMAESVREAHFNSPLFSRNENFGEIIEMNFA